MTTLYLQRMRAIPRDAWLAMSTYGLIYLNYFGVSGVLLNLYLLRLGYDVRYVGLVSAALIAAYAAGSPLAGWLGRRWGSRRPMIWGMAASAVGATLVPLGGLMPPGVRTVWLPLANAFTGLGFALPATNCTVYLREVCGDAGCDHAFAIRGALAPAAAFVGSLIGGLLPTAIAPVLGVGAQDPLAFQWPLIGAGLALGLGALTLLPTREVAAPVLSGAGEPARASPLPLAPIAAIMLYMLLSFVAGSPDTFMTVYLDERLSASTAAIGLVRALGQILSIPAALLMPMATARWGRAQAVVWGGLGRWVTWLALALVPDPAVASLCFILSPALFAFTEGALAGYQQGLVAPEWRSVMVGMALLTGGGAGAAMALAGGHLIASFGYVALFLISAGAAFVSAAFLWAYDRRRRPSRVAA